MLALMATCSAYSQKLRSVDLKTEWSGDGKALQFYATNNDYCDYYLYINLTDLKDFEYFFSPYTATINKGERSLFSLKREGVVPPSYSSSYGYFRGNVNLKVNPGYIYALPVKSGDSIQIKPKENSAYTLLFNLKYASDTIYACRGGIVCDDNLYDVMDMYNNRKYNQLTVYHADGSFGKYTHWDTSLVSPGQVVEVGTPIAVVSKGNKKLNESFSFAVYFLDKNQLKDLKKGNKYTYLVPVFHTGNAGDIKLDAAKTYVSDITNDLIMQDMSKKEKSKYLKKINK